MGWVVYNHHTLKAAVKKRKMNRLAENKREETIHVVRRRTRVLARLGEADYVTL